MKKNKALFVVFILLLLVSAYFIATHSSSTIKSELSEFAVKDTASITKIFLADRKNNQVTLSRKNNTWYVNDETRARTDAMNTLLRTFYQIEVRSPIGERAENTVIRHLSSVGIKCEIYLNDNSKPEKVYYVGSGTQDMLGTFMYIENSTVPFAVHIPGFDGYLTPRYTPMPDNWVLPSVFDISAPNIRSVNLSYFDEQKKSFALNRINEIDFEVIDLESKESIPNVKQNLIQAYLDQFRGVNFEGRVINMTESKKDSIIEIGPFAILNITDKNNKTVSLDMYRMDLSERSKNIFDEEHEFDVDRFYGSINKNSDWVVLQYFVFEKLLLQPKNFVPGQ